jgi:multicomponent Na+:H+ antiporter subunit D
MTELNFPPGFILIIGALILPFLSKSRSAWRAVSLLAPLATLAGIWLFPDQGKVTTQFLDFELVLAQFNLPTKAFATVFALMAFTGALFALNQDRRVELPGAFLYAGSAIGVTFAGDLFTLFVFWELMAVGSTIVVWANFTDRSRRAGIRYVNVHLIGGVIFMLGIALYVHSAPDAPAGMDATEWMSRWIAVPTMKLAEDGNGIVLIKEAVQVARPDGTFAAHSPFASLDSPGSALMLIGILVNTGAPPFGSWLPDAYPEASASGTVFLSAFTTKTSVYVLMVLYAGTHVLIYVGALMAVYGIVYAILENDIRRILSYSIINQVGFMVCAVGLGTGLSINGATAHAFAHIIYKALLLMSAGSVLYMTGKRLCTDVGGLYRTMPITMWCGIIGALAISAMPLTSGFTTKSMITDAAAYNHETLAWFVLVAASAGVFLHAGIKFPWFVFFQRDSGLRPKDPPKNMSGAMIFFSVLCIFLGVYPKPLYDILPFTAQFQSSFPGEPLYQAFSWAHVLSQLQLLLFSGLAFFVLLPMLKRTLTITLDADWSYRRLVPQLWKHILRPVLELLEPVHLGLIQGLPRLAAREFGAPKTASARWRSWGVGQTVLLLTVFLTIFLFLNLFG